MNMQQGLDPENQGMRWLPLGIDSDEAVAEYDALNDGLPAWLASIFHEAWFPV
ncbi:hypothetical protein [Arthrobacter sp. CAN_A1]|uniref:hypothetical protein n=1 Tax=Arthrobacter sp. CAN_A1 TaxID=2787717 RepID=UPI0018C953F3